MAKGWIRMNECPVCGKDRCVYRERRKNAKTRMIYCYRMDKTYFTDENGNIAGLAANRCPEKSGDKNQQSFDFGANQYEQELL